MAKRQISDGRTPTELPFPAGGLDEESALEHQRPGTTPDCLNVRATRPQDGRVGGCQRSGIQRYCPDQISGENPVQEIHKVVVESAQTTPFGPGLSYVYDGTSIVILDKDGNIAAAFPPPSGGTPGPGIFDQRGNLIQQNTTSSTFRTDMRRTQPVVSPQPFFSSINFQRQFPFFNPEPRIPPGGQGLLQGGAEAAGQAEQQQDGDDGLQHIRDLDQFPPGVFGPAAGPAAAWPDGGALPGGNSLIRTALGTSQGKATTTVTVSGVVATAGAVLVVLIVEKGGGVASISWNSQTFTQRASAQNGADVSSWIFTADNLSTLSVADLVVTATGTFTAASVLVLQIAHPDGATIIDTYATEDTTTGSSDAPGDDAGIAVTSLPSMLISVVGMNGPEEDTDGSWSNNFLAGQVDGTTGGAAGGNVKAMEGYRMVTAAATVLAAKTGVTSRAWAVATLGISD